VAARAEDASVQFVIVKPALAIAAIVTETLDVYCATSQSFKIANVYLEIVDFICVSVALYGLVSSCRDSI